MQESVLAGSLAALASVTAWIAHGQERQPLLDAMQVTMEGNIVLDAYFGHGDSEIDGPHFDQSANEWRMVVERGESIALRRYLITINESSGGVCVRTVPSSGCAAKGDAGVALKAAQDK